MENTFFALDKLFFLHNNKQLKSFPSLKNNKIRMYEYNCYFKELIIIPIILNKPKFNPDFFEH